VNLGGQILQQKDMDQLRTDIGSGKLKTWKEIHRRYDRLWQKYPHDKQKHSYSILCELAGTDRINEEQWSSSLKRLLEIQQYISDQVYISRKKDYENPYRAITFRNKDEMKAAIGSVDENSFILQVKQETDELRKKVESMKLPTGVES
jgi:hypothetical protein